MAVPKLRFRDDEGREFPGWIERELKAFSEINPKTAPVPEKFVYIDLESVEKGALLKETIISKSGAPSRAQRLLKKEDILFQMVRPYQGNNFFFNENGIFVASTGYAQIRTLENPRFLYQYLHLEGFTAEVMDRCTGTSYPAINSTDLGLILISLPSRPEQTKIANFLTAIDAKISQLTKKHQLLSSYKKGVLQKIFSQELRFKDDEGEEFEGWEERKLKNLVNAIGSGGTPKSTINEYYGGDIPWVSIADMTSSDKKISNTKRKLTALGLQSSSAKLFPAGTILFAMYASIGECSIAEIPVTTSQAILGIQPNTSLLNLFLYFWLHHLKEKFQLMGQQGTQANLNLDIVKNLEINLPCLNEQTKIANFLTAIDDRITNAKSQLEATKQYKQGLLQQMFV